MNCPICGEKMTSKSWSDDIAGATTTVETLNKCPSGHYQDHYAYGDYEIIVGNRQWNWSYNTSASQIAKVEAEIETAINEARAAFKSNQEAADAPAE